MSSNSPTATPSQSVVPNDNGESQALTTTNPSSSSDAADDYLRLLALIRSASPDTPDLHITYKNLAYTVDVPISDTKIKNLLHISRDFFARAIPRFLVPEAMRPPFVTMHSLAPCEGYIRPASMTLILAPPGHGKSTLLKALSGRFEGDSKFTGEVRYNGLNPQDCAARSVHVSRLTSYVGQTDIHFPVLTVRETLRFAAESACAKVSLLTPKMDKAAAAELEKLEAKRPELLAHMLGMDECIDTVIGNDLLRGISGGQKKRVTLGEMLISNARALFLDEVSTGLDSAVTFHIFHALQKWARSCRGSIVTALLQPTPETYDLFDDLILMKEGEVVYHGPREKIRAWADAVGLHMPADADVAGVLVDYLNDPEGAVKKLKKQVELKEMLLKKEREQKEKEDIGGGSVVAKTGTLPPSFSNQNNNNTSSAQNTSRGVSGTAGPSAVQLVNGIAAAGAFGNVGNFEGREDSELSVVNFHNGEGDELEHGYGFTNGKELDYESKHNHDGAAVRLLPSAVQPNYGKTTTSSTNSFLSHTDDLVKFYHSSPYYTDLLVESDRSLSAYKSELTYDLNPTRWSPFTISSYGRGYAHSWIEHLRLNIVRQTKLVKRNRSVNVPRLFQACFMGFVYGTLFFQLSTDEFDSRFGLILLVLMNGAFANLSELPIACEARNVVTKQLDGGFFPAIPYVFSVAVLSLPLATVETLVFGTLMYWIPSFTADAGRYFFFLLCVFSSNLSLSTFFRTISYVAPNPDVARQMDLPFIILFVIFGGFLLPRDKIQNWLIWIYWLNPLAWATRSLALSEFNAPRYDYLVTNSGVTERAGNYYMEQYNFYTDDAYRWAGIGYLLGIFLVFIVVSSVALLNVRGLAALGTKRLGNEPATKDELGAILLDVNAPAAGKGANGINGTAQPVTSEGTQDGDLSHRVIVKEKVNGLQAPNGSNGVGAPPISRQSSSKNRSKNRSGRMARNDTSFRMSSLPFIPVSLVWRNIRYTVQVPDGKGGWKDKVLLKGISGCSPPGSLTALMGSSGAGKTTLMDVIAGRKTVGVIEGDILVNGVPKDVRAFNRLTGYVEQQDLHMGLCTVEEALEFSAKLRLPTSVQAEERTAWVKQVMELVGLTPIRKRLIGDAALPGLSPGQMKLVTIGVELVANPSIIFLDEPTSGLDAPSAARVMIAVRRIAATGRSVLCTIHQPAQDLFLMFDRLLLLRSGGEVVYNTKIGPAATQLVHYLETIDTAAVAKGTAPKLPFGINPANFMLDVIGAGHASAEGGAIADMGYEAADYVALWKGSELARASDKEIEQNAVADQTNAMEAALQETYLSELSRFLALTHRYFVMHSRNGPTNFTRVLLMVTMGVLLGVIYLKIEANDFAGVQSMLAVLFLGLAFPASIAASAAFPSFFRQRAVYYRENTIGMYHYLSYNAAMTLVELPYIFFSLVFFTIPFYFLVGLVNDGNLFFKYFLVVYLMAILYSSLSFCWLAFLPSAIASNVVNGMFMSLFFVFGGLFDKASAIPAGWKWFYWIDPIPKAFIAGAMTQFYCDDQGLPALGNPCPTINAPNGLQVTSNYVSDLIEGSESEYWPMVGWLILTIAILRVFNIIGLKYVSHIKR